LNWIQIQLKKNEMQIGGEEFQNLLVNMVLEKKLEKKRLSMPLDLGMGKNILIKKKFSVIWLMELKVYPTKTNSNESLSLKLKFIYLDRCLYLLI